MSYRLQAKILYAALTAAIGAPGASKSKVISKIVWLAVPSTDLVTGYASGYVSLCWSLSRQDMMVTGINEAAVGALAVIKYGKVCVPVPVSPIPRSPCFYSDGSTSRPMDRNSGLLTVPIGSEENFPCLHSYTYRLHLRRISSLCYILHLRRHWPVFFGATKLPWYLFDLALVLHVLCLKLLLYVDKLSFSHSEETEFVNEISGFMATLNGE